MGNYGFQSGIEQIGFASKLATYMPTHKDVDNRNMFGQNGIYVQRKANTHWSELVGRVMLHSNLVHETEISKHPLNMKKKLEVVVGEERNFVSYRIKDVGLPSRGSLLISWAGHALNYNDISH